MERIVRLARDRGRPTVLEKSMSKAELMEDTRERKERDPDPNQPPVIRFPDSNSSANVSYMDGSERKNSCKSRQIHH
jgi:hypothetical protein